MEDETFNIQHLWQYKEWRILNLHSLWRWKLQKFLLTEPFFRNIYYNYQSSNEVILKNFFQSIVSSAFYFFAAVQVLISGTNILVNHFCSWNYKIATILLQSFHCVCEFYENIFQILCFNILIAAQVKIKSLSLYCCQH